MPLMYKSRLNHFFGIGLLLILLLGACRESAPPQPPQTASRPTPLPQDAIVEVFFNHAESANYTDPYRNKQRAGDNLEQIIVDTILSAQSSVDVAVQEFRLPRIAQALADRHRAGVKVRVILENTYNRPWSAISAAERVKFDQRQRDRYQEMVKLADRDRDGILSPQEIQTGDSLVVLQRGNVPWIDDTADGSAGSNLMHHKFLVIDRQKVIATSSNFTLSDAHGDFKSPTSTGNANNLLKIDSQEVAAAFTQEFEIMWGDGPGGKKDSRFGSKKPFRPAQTFQFGLTQITIQFSPTSKKIAWANSTNGLIARTLATATQQVDLALFVFSDQQLVNRLEPLALQGLPIRALIDPQFAYRSYSEALDMLGVELMDQQKGRVRCQLETGNRPWRQPIATVGVPRLARGDLLHHKFGIVDDRIVITGSHNWTEAANLGNDETVLVVQSPLVAAHFQREFDRLYRTAITGIPPAIQRKAQKQLSQCQGGARKAEAGQRSHPAKSERQRKAEL